ncbi:hypothetical protein B0O95_1114 [Mycetohabitans endofungorum]|uniref:Uncharacterized protein n=1 Tax=Mycetohabitans endofungorum TaxID=417203 RepID=A0A2P5K8A2_9BURK|nr:MULTISPECIES: hypothetical protein [Mycetohabitans]PPB82946.1 hypothetical protein B0O95_1114 [Mycetohabitans endofungorum]
MERLAYGAVSRELNGAEETCLLGEAAMQIKRVGLKKQMYDEAGSLALANDGF